MVLSPAFLRSAIAESRADLIYLNSFFDPISTMVLLWRRLRLIPSVPVLLAPRGEFSPGALGIRAPKKQWFIRIARRLGLYRDIHWHASTTWEAAEITSAIPEVSRVHVAPDLSPALQRGTHGLPRPPWAARFVFFARISPMKNLLWALERLTQIEGHVDMTVYGPVSDSSDWSRCKAVVNRLPDNVDFRYAGELPPDALQSKLGAHHFLLFPTLGENFGHTIAESLQCGLPVLISDQTPWRGLAPARAGWDLPLGDAAQWRDAIQQCVDMDENGYAEMSPTSQGVWRGVALSTWWRAGDARGV